MPRSGRGMPLNTQLTYGEISDAPGEEHFVTAVVDGGGFIFYTLTTTRSLSVPTVNGGGTVTADIGKVKDLSSVVISGGGTVSASINRTGRRIKVAHDKIFGPGTYEDIFGDTPRRIYKD